MAGQATVKIGDREWLGDVATQPWELSQGLGGLSVLLAGTGMLFDLEWEQIIEVTTVPMLFPLDIVFFSDDLTVTELYRNVEPGYLVTSQLPTRYFLEVNAGELADIEAGSQAEISLLSTGNAAAAPDLTPVIFGFMGFMMMGIFMIGIVRDLTAEAIKEPEKKPLLDGLRGEKLLAQTSRKVDLWVEITSVVENELGKRTNLPAGQIRQIAEVVTHRVEKRAGGLAWIELRDGTTFERIGKAQINQGLKIFAALDGYLGLTTKLWHADRIAVADVIDGRLKEAGVIALRDGTTFRKTFKPGKSSMAVVGRKVNSVPRLAGQQEELDLLSDSPEFLAYTIDDIGFREKIDSAFQEAISRARGLE